MTTPFRPVPSLEHKPDRLDRLLDLLFWLFVVALVTGLVVVWVLT